MKKSKNPETGVVHWTTDKKGPYDLFYINLCGSETGLIWTRAADDKVTCRKCLSIKPDADILDQWDTGRENAKTVEEKTKFNVWDNFIDQVVPIVDLARHGLWFWFANPLREKVRYINVRIDMRDGHCIIKDNDGNRINPEDLAAQKGRNT